jgi:hypothetical protein
MSQCYMNFDRLTETINLTNALNEASHKRTVQVMSEGQSVSRREGNGVLYERVNGVLRKK